MAKTPFNQDLGTTGSPNDYTVPAGKYAVFSASASSIAGVALGIDGDTAWVNGSGPMMAGPFVATAGQTIESRNSQRLFIYGFEYDV